MKDKLECEEIIKLKLIDKKNKNTEEETALISLACGLCFDFSPKNKYSFILGTEEGNIHKCSTAYSGQYQETFEGHQLAVYNVFLISLNILLLIKMYFCLHLLIGQ
jgi:dynein intermediate chain 1